MEDKIAIIPARKGSKRIPNKNVRSLNGKPIIAYSIETAINANIFKTVLVSTDCDKIANIAKNYGAEVPYLRSKETANDYAILNDVLIEVLNKEKQRGLQYQSVTMLMPCSPLINVNDLIQANNLFDENNGKFPVLSVSKLPCPAEESMKEDGNGILKPISNLFYSTRSQDIKESFFDTGNFFIRNIESIINKPIDKSGFLKYEIEKYRAIDVNTTDDIIFLEKLFKLNVS